MFTRGHCGPFGAHACVEKVLAGRMGDQAERPSAASSCLNVSADFRSLQLRCTSTHEENAAEPDKSAAAFWASI
jgi:hypothetical protein